MPGTAILPTLNEMLATVAAADRTEPPVLAALRRGRSPIRFDSTRTWFATWDAVQGLLRDFAMHMVLPAVRLHRNPEFPREAVPATIAGFLLPNARFLAQFGFPELPRWAEALAAADPGDPNLDAALSAYGRYVNRLNAWAFHHFPWDRPEVTVAEAAPVKGPPEIEADLAPTEDLIRITFPDLGVSVRAWLAVDGNPELVADVRAALPFTTFLDHASTAGDEMVAWVPLFSTALPRLTERLCDAPAGRLGFSQSAGQQFAIQYGRSVDLFEVAVLGGVLAGDLATLREVGAKVRHATMVTKDLIWMTVAAA